MSYLELLPAVEVKDGRAVRLVQGELDKESITEHHLMSPLNFRPQALNGCTWLILMQHLVEEKTLPCWQRLLESLISKSNFQVEFAMMNLYVVPLQQVVAELI